MGFATPIDGLFKNPEYHDILSLIKGARNGAVYGAKIRFPHALVMTFLFKRGTVWEKLQLVLRATYQHSRNLSLFVLIYKTLMLAQRKVKGNEDSMDALIAGFVGGWLIFGKNNNINHQIVLYLFSRITLGGVKYLAEKVRYEPRIDPFPVFAATVWAVVMWLFRHHRAVLQGSLQSSMQYLYNDSEVFSSFRDCLWYNK